MKETYLANEFRKMILKNVEVVFHVINLRIQSPEVAEPSKCGLMPWLLALGCRY